MELRDVGCSSAQVSGPHSARACIASADVAPFSRPPRSPRAPSSRPPRSPLATAQSMICVSVF
eukprot:3938395-Rhodomonas_salina.1